MLFPVSAVFEKCFDLCHASSLWKLCFVQSSISDVFKSSTLPLPYVQMLDPRDKSWCQIPAPVGMKAGQMPGDCRMGLFKLRFD